jgi:hypothetical protein
MTDDALLTDSPKALPAVVRGGIGANCSSMGSMVDMLFCGTAAGAALFLAVGVALRKVSDEPQPEPQPEPPPESPPKHEPADRVSAESMASLEGGTHGTVAKGSESVAPRKEDGP